MLHVQFKHIKLRPLFPRLYERAANAFSWPLGSPSSELFSTIWRYSFKKRLPKRYDGFGMLIFELYMYADLARFIPATVHKQLLLKVTGLAVAADTGNRAMWCRRARWRPPESA